VITVGEAVTLLVASFILTFVTLSAPLVLYTVARLSPEFRRRLASLEPGHRAVAYTIAYALYATVTPGDTLVATLLYTALLVALVELTLYITRRQS
jgi:hypothetical protein